MNELTLLLNAARMDPILRDAVLLVEKRLLAAERALQEVHDFHCGCAQPGHRHVCVAVPCESFASVDPLSLSSMAGDDDGA